MTVRASFDADEHLITLCRAGGDTFSLDFDEARDLVPDLQALIVAHDMPRQELPAAADRPA